MAVDFNEGVEARCAARACQPATLTRGGFGPAKCEGVEKEKPGDGGRAITRVVARDAR